MFSKQRLFYICGNGTFLASSTKISGRNFQVQKMKKKLLKCFLYFGKWNFLATSSKSSLYFRKELAKPENKKFHIFCLLRENFSNISAKQKSFL